MPQYLGQHFLTNHKKVEEIIDALNLSKNDFLIEIGPGQGALTDDLVSKSHDLDFKIIAIEKDEVLAEQLQNKYAQNKNIEIIKGDALKILPSLKETGGLVSNFSYKIVGNIPYYITGYLLRTIGELKNKPSLTVLMIQKEVAERLSAEPPKMNLLAASVQFWANPQIIAYLKPGEFNPPPKVDSAVIKLETKPLLKKLSEENYYKFIRIAFQQPRKTLLNNLSTGFDLPKEKAAQEISALGLAPEVRAQNLTLEELKKLAEKIKELE